MQDDALEDPHLWLEAITGDRALAWVHERNAECALALARSPDFAALEARLLEILDSEARIPWASLHGAHLYNFWRDAAHPRGIWRRTSPAEFERDEPCWETVLDLDAVASSEGESWQWASAIWCEPNHDRCLVRLSRGGGDAHVVREYDPDGKSFVDGGFALDEAKSHVDFIDRDTVYVATDFGPGSLNDSGYPRQVRRWRRGTPLSAAELVFEGAANDVGVAAWREHGDDKPTDLVVRVLTSQTHELFRVGERGLERIDKPIDAGAAFFRGWLLLRLRSDLEVGGQRHPAGALLAARLGEHEAGSRDFTVLFAPTERRSLAGFGFTRRHVLLTVLDDVKSRLSALALGPDGFAEVELPGLPTTATLAAWAVDRHRTDDYFATATDFLAPTRLYHGTAGGGAPRVLKALPPFFAAEGLAVEQREIRSADGTRVPYFVVARGDLPRDGHQPTLLTGYGGFEISRLPQYDAHVGAAWLERGGVYALANIRGGGEFGPAWHQAALRERRPRAYEDFIAVAEDLVARGVTSPPHLGALGGSNGGLLVGNMLTRRPDLFGAIVCAMPLLDMRRYHRLLAGASWMAEFGDPDDPADWAYLQGISPYHNLDPGRHYPPVLFLSSTRDDRVHPGHARKMAARMYALGANVLYYENVEGGHAGAADNRQAAHKAALTYTFLHRALRERRPPCPQRAGSPSDPGHCSGATGRGSNRADRH